MNRRDPIAGLEGLYFVAKRLVDGLYTGRHASPMRGSGIEFHDYRPYTPGDDLRDIDWKRFGRTDRYYLKRYRRETDLNLCVLVDGSASMDFASIDAPEKRRGSHIAGANASQLTKFAVAQRLAAALATLAIRQGDRASVCVFDRSLRGLQPSTGSLRRLQPMLADLENQTPSQGPADLPACLEQLAHAFTKHKAAIAVVGDLLDEVEPMLAALDRLRFAGHEVLVFQVLTPDELALPSESRGLRMIDPELGASVHTQPRQVAASYRQQIDAHLAKLRRSLAARDMDYTLINTREPMLDALRRHLQQRASRSR